MRSGVIAQKVGMTRVFTDGGEHVSVTVLRLANCQVVAHRTKDKNGYVALQLGSGTRGKSAIDVAHEMLAAYGSLAEVAGREVVELGPVNATIHMIDERVRIADLEPLAAIYRGILDRVLLADPAPA